MHVYSDPRRESDPHALPDVEVFYVAPHNAHGPYSAQLDLEAGWYWWSAFPGCMPDGDPEGPFATAEEATAAARVVGEDDE